MALDVLKLTVGEIAPDFTLQATPDQSLRMSELRGRPVVLVFYPADWSPVCGDQIGLYNELLAEFSQYQAQILGISVDGVWCHAAFARERKLHFPLLADRLTPPAGMTCSTRISSRCPIAVWLRMRKDWVSRKT
jgi:peroxiredoxin